MSVPRAIADFLEEWQIAPSHLLVGVSGGHDSTALLIALQELPGRLFSITAGHVNHHLRGEESIEDEAWLQLLCDRLEINLLVSPGDLSPAAIRERGIEAAAREVRYHELERMRQTCGADWIATAHQKNDQAETVLLRLITGAGVSRLGAIVPVRNRMIRPLLEVTRPEIERFLEEREIHPRHDRSNVDLRFTRNWIRWEILPLLEQRNARIVDALAETAREAREQQAIIGDLLESLSLHWARGDNQTVIDLQDLPPDPGLQKAILLGEVQRLDPLGREVSRASLGRIVRALPELRRTTLSRNLEILRRGRRILLRRLLPSGVAFEEPLVPGTAVELPMIDAVVCLRKVEGEMPPLTDQRRHRQLFQIPAEGPFDFLIRSRRPGDRFHPLGLRREKKLNEFLIDRKIPLEIRDSLPLLTWNHEIVWVGGVEISEKFKVTDPPREVYEISITRAAAEEKQP